jgi:hypothetical protein
MSNLASMYWNQGRWKEAEDPELQVMEMRKRVLGAEHPDTLISMNGFAWTWKSQDRNKEAVELMDKCIQLQKKKLGTDHPYTKFSLKAMSQ